MKLTAPLVFLASLGVALAGCGPHNNQSWHPSPAISYSDGEIDSMLPADIMAQKDFPHPYVLSMVRACLPKTVKENPEKTEQAKNYCTCIVIGIIHHFTLREYLDAGNAGWDRKSVPEANKKRTEVMASCIQTTEH